MSQTTIAGGKTMYLSTIIKSLFLYLDPGSGQFFLQVLIASMVGIGFAFRGYWGKFVTKITGKTITDDEEEEEE
jgi:hypothetical protein